MEIETSSSFIRISKGAYRAT